jgi:glucose-1-phosphate cytidylyltransferase
MKYYAHFGHRDFILCLGHQAQAIKQYFLKYDECISNDFTLCGGGRDIKMARRDIEDWTIAFVDTGVNSNIGQRLVAVRDYLRGEEMFLANYSDGLTDCFLPEMIEQARAEDRVAAFLCVRPSFSCHFVETCETGEVSAIRSGEQANLWINGGFFVLRQSIFDYIREGEELVVEPFHRLLRERKLLARKYEGFFQAMDTFKERQYLERLYSEGNGHAAWMVWARSQPRAERRSRGE